MNSDPVIIVGAGPAGLTAGYELCKTKRTPVIFEKSNHVGGISRTEEYKGYRFDIGGHRFFTKISEVNALWREILGDDLIRVKRLSRIYYDGKFYFYPLNLFNTFLNLGPIESLRILLSYSRARLFKPYPEETNLEQWVINRFGDRLYRTFFKTYTEKVWGIPCAEISADWAAQRIRNLSIKRAILHALGIRRSDATTLVDSFLYPVLGPGMMWEACRDRIVDNGGTVEMETEVVRINLRNNRFHSVLVSKNGVEQEVNGTHLINSMPITSFIRRLSPPPPQEILNAAAGLKYRDFLVVALILDHADPFPDNWIYIHSPSVHVGRIQNFRNWSASMVPDLEKSCIGMEYFCTRGDHLWERSDAELFDLAKRELAEIGLVPETAVIDGTILRQSMAYPVYDGSYKDRLSLIRTYLDTLENVQTVGRAGMHRYNNQDHSMLTAMLAVKNIFGSSEDLWSVNVERSYAESFLVDSREDQEESIPPIGPVPSDTLNKERNVNRSKPEKTDFHSEEVSGSTSF